MDETVCVDHISDDVLHAELSAIADKFECSFCGRKIEPGEPAFAVELDEVGVLLNVGEVPCVSERCACNVCLVEHDDELLDIFRERFGEVECVVVLLTSFRSL